MWRKLLLVLLGMVLLGLLLVGYQAVAMLKPEVIDHDLRREFHSTGLTVGQATRAEMEAQFGQPERERAEASGTLFEYPSKGLLFRMNREPGTLYWYEFTGPAFATAKGLRVGDTFDAVKSAYGYPTDVTNLKAGLRIRYSYGTMYTLEFWVDPASNRVTRILFFKS